MEKQSIDINFQQGVNTKQDPWQIALGQFLVLNNGVFTTGDLLGKRPGYGGLATPTGANYLCTLNGNLLALGSTLNIYSQSNNSWIQKAGPSQPCALSVLPLVRNNLNQTQTDSAVINGLTCVVYTQVYASSTAAVTNYLFMVYDSVTGQSVIAPGAMPVIAGGTFNGSSRVFAAGTLFVIVSQVTTGGNAYLQYFVIDATNPTVVSGAVKVFNSIAYPDQGTYHNWDGVYVTGGLFISYLVVSAISMKTVYISDALLSSVSSSVTSYDQAVANGSIASVCADTTVSPAIIYVSYFDLTSVNTFAVYFSGGTVHLQFAAVSVYTAAIVNITSSAAANSCTVIFEITNAYGYDSTIPSNYTFSASVSNVGAISGGSILIRGVGLASKSFIYNSQVYVLMAYQSPYQPSYFLINITLTSPVQPFIVAKLAYQNGGGYLTQGLPNVTVTNGVAQLSYLYKQNVQALNTAANTQASQTGGIYSQLGINQASFNLATTLLNSIELGGNINFSGGYLSSFDGRYPTEQDFFLFPDSIKVAYTVNSVVTPTGSWANGATIVTLSSGSGVYPGMSIVDTTGGHSAYFQANTLITFVNGTTITINKPTTHSAAGDALSIQGNIAAQPDGITNTNAYWYRVTYEWTDAKGNPYYSAPSVAVSVTTSAAASTGINTLSIPTLRLTAKLGTSAGAPGKVKIGVYRLSAQTQVYNQVTSILYPLLNDNTVDYLTFVDALPDGSIIGNNLLYTTGGVLPDTNAPACQVMTAFDTRLALVASEDENTLWISKTVIPQTPVEFSSGLTIYVAPNVGTVGNTGGIKSLFPMDDKLILGKNGSFFYINGTGPDILGTTSPGSPLGYYSQPIFITSAAGCTNQRSMVLIPDGLLFQSSTDGGLWLISRNLEASFLGAPSYAFTKNASVTSAVVVPGSTYVVFTLDSGTMVMFDYYYRQWGTFTGPNPVLSSCIYNGLHTIIDNTGAVYQQTPGVYLDGATPVAMNFQTGWIKLAGLQGYQRIYDFNIVGNYLSSHQIQTQINYDFSSTDLHTALITPTNTAANTLENWRIHAKKQLCQSFSLTMTEIDSSAGAGFTLSGINCQIGVKKGIKPFAGANAVG